MKRKAEIQKAYDEAVEYMQLENPLEQGNSVEMCAGFQHALLWILGRSTHHVFKLKREKKDDIANRI
tara:strand:+ start:320 stop:520 length:201 start_codon:yes stop_codon:yes gene_type:complete